MRKKFFEDMQFNDDNEILNYLRESTNNFDIIDFYNGKGTSSALIVITPFQVIKINSVDRHGDALNWLYYLIYNNCSDVEYENINNIVIRMVHGSSYTFYPIFPHNNTINEFQADAFNEIINQLKDYEEDINFGSEADLKMFAATYHDSINKISNANVVKELPLATMEQYDIQRHIVL